MSIQDFDEGSAYAWYTITLNMSVTNKDSRTTVKHKSETGVIVFIFYLSRFKNLI